MIRTNIQLAKAQEAGTDIFHFDKYSNGATDYRNLAEEFLSRIESQVILEYASLTGGLKNELTPFFEVMIPCRISGTFLLSCRIENNFN